MSKHISALIGAMTFSRCYHSHGSPTVACKSHHIVGREASGQAGFLVGLLRGVMQHWYDMVLGRA